MWSGWLGVGWVGDGRGVTQLSSHKRPQLTHDSQPSRPTTHAILQTHANPLTSDQPTIEPTSRLNAKLARVLILVEVTSPLEQEFPWVVENYVDTNIIGGGRGVLSLAVPEAPAPSCSSVPRWRLAILALNRNSLTDRLPIDVDVGNALSVSLGGGYRLAPIDIQTHRPNGPFPKYAYLFPLDQSIIHA
jgi:hypothetical protein